MQKKTASNYSTLFPDLALHSSHTVQHNTIKINDIINISLQIWIFFSELLVFNWFSYELRGEFFLLARIADYVILLIHYVSKLNTLNLTARCNVSNVHKPTSSGLVIYKKYKFKKQLTLSDTDSDDDDILHDSLTSFKLCIFDERCWWLHLLCSIEIERCCVYVFRQTKSTNISVWELSRIRNRRKRARAIGMQTFAEPQLKSQSQYTTRHTIRYARHIPYIGTNSIER